MRVMCT